MSISLESIVERMREREARYSQVPLSQRELQILELVCRGMPSKDIAKKVGTSKSTVENQRRAILTKLGAKSLANLGWIACFRGLV